MTDAPKTASSVVNSAYVTTTVSDASTSLDSTDGIKKAVAANTAAIKMLAEHIDGANKPATPPEIGRAHV